MAHLGPVRGGDAADGRDQRGRFGAPFSVRQRLEAGHNWAEGLGGAIGGEKLLRCPDDVQ